jgi:hypothetical protein
LNDIAQVRNLQDKPMSRLKKTRAEVRDAESAVFRGGPDLDDPESVRAFSKRLERGFQLSVQKAVREHLAAGRAIYYMERNQIIKHMPDGRRFVVRVLKDAPR